MQPLMPKRQKPEVKRSVERHKHLLLSSTRDLIRAMREESAPQ
jgi:hypothetical protein